MKILICFLLLLPAIAIAEEEPLKQNYEGNIRGVRALMSDLKQNQPNIYSRLKNDFDDLDSRQSRADTIAYTAYGVSAGLMIYGLAKCFGAFNSSNPGESGFTLTPFLLSIGTTLGGTWAYALTRPSPQEYLDFTNKHNRLNKKQQLEWKLSFDLRHKGAGLGLAYQF